MEGWMKATLPAVRASGHQKARCAINLDPLAGDPGYAKHIKETNLRGTIKELAQLDGAFVVTDNGAVVAACRLLECNGEWRAVAPWFAQPPFCRGLQFNSNRRGCDSSLRRPLW
jgi:hypothetical protein